MGDHMTTIWQYAVFPGCEMSGGGITMGQRKMSVTKRINLQITVTLPLEWIQKKCIRRICMGE